MAQKPQYGFGTESSHGSGYRSCLFAFFARPQTKGLPGLGTLFALAHIAGLNLVKYRLPWLIGFLCCVLQPLIGLGDILFCSSALLLQLESFAASSLEPRILSEVISMGSPP